MALSPQDIAGYAKAAGFPQNELATAVAVAYAESGGNPQAVNNKNKNGSTDYGLWQINTVHGALLNQGDKFDPAANARMAYTIWKGAGSKWTPWSAYNNGSYIAQKPKGVLGAAAPTAHGSAPAAGPPLVSPEGEPIPQDPGGGAAIPTIPGAGVLGDLAAPLMSLLGSLQTFTTTLSTALTTLLSGGFWLRIAAFIAGGGLVVFSLAHLSGVDKTMVKAGKTAGKAGLAVATRGVL